MTSQALQGVFRSLRLYHGAAAPRAEMDKLYRQFVNAGDLVFDIGAHVGSFTVMCNHYWPNAKIVSVEPHPDSFELLKRNTQHVPASQLLLINAAITKKSGKCLLASPVSHSRVAEYVPDVWVSLQPRYKDFGIEVSALTVEQLWKQINEWSVSEVDLLKLDCEGAEYVVIPELSALGLMSQVG